MSQNPLSTVEPWDLVSEGYIQELAPVFKKWAADSVKGIPLSSDDEVIDVACGPGTVSLMVAPLVKQVVALDFSQKMISALQQQKSLLNVENLETHLCDCQALPLESNRFDAAFSQFGLMFFSNRKKGFGEIFRVLKPGGNISVSSWAPIQQSTAMTTMLDALEAGFKSKMASPKESRNIVKGLDDKETFVTELEGAGFTDIRIEEVTHRFPSATPAEYWQSAVTSSAPIALMRANMSEAEWAEGEQRAIDCIALHLEEKKEFHSTAYLAFARKPGCH
ncbi:MAG: methyltransferase domain-containing protein [Deltaproteobacteria bacterium]|nr:methyltransferase domain-containing protein [Deltaproteobacteria bacterium]